MLKPFKLAFKSHAYNILYSSKLWRICLLISQTFLVLRMSTSTENPYQFSSPHVLFLRQNKAAWSSTSNHSLSTAAENFCCIVYSKFAALLSHSPRAVCYLDTEQFIIDEYLFSKRNAIYVFSSLRGKPSVRNMAAQPEVRNILSTKIVFIAVEKGLVRRTRQSNFISTRKGNVWCRKLVRISRRRRVLELLCQGFGGKMKGKEAAIQICIRYLKFPLATSFGSRH